MGQPFDGRDEQGSYFNAIARWEAKASVNGGGNGSRNWEEQVPFQSFEAWPLRALMNAGSGAL
jgi:hypothetical protein